jgi:oligopeptide/dipeptide ABC transporter ATP-binding protein
MTQTNRSSAATAVTGEREAPLLEVTNLSVTYRQGLRRPPVRAVRGVSFTVGRGETVSIVGESGSGKSTIGGAILGLRQVTEGTIRFNGEDITSLPVKRRREISAHLQAVFQDPYSSLDPARTIGESVSEPLQVGASIPRGEVTTKTAEVLGRVGMAASAVSKYPSEFSGGQRQRISIARAIVRTPELVVCDEAVSALDVSVQAHVLNLLGRLQKDSDTSYVFISHNMAVVRHVSDRVVVLYQGRVMEEGPAVETCDTPMHPYTRSLVAAVPVPNVQQQRARRELRSEATRASGLQLEGDVGCPFAPRCPFALQRCVETTPEPIEFAPGRRAACVRIGDPELALESVSSSIRPTVKP